MPRKHRRYRLLFDEGLPLPQTFPQLNNLFDVKHIVHDCKLAGADDIHVYQVAVKERRLIVTFNKKHFRALALNSQDTGVIAISHTLPPSQRDTKLTAFLRRKTPADLYGTFNAITGETTTKEDVSLDE